MPKFQRGFATKAKELKGAAGDPLEDEHEAVHNGHRIVHQLTTAGEFVWHEKQNMVHFYPSAVKAPAVAPPKPTTPTVPGELNIEWVGTPNFSDRRGAKPHVIVIHTAVGSLVGMNGWFNSPKNKETSAHYGIGLDGKTVQYVKEEMAAHANGIKTPENRWPFPGWPNGNTISIETADNGRPETEPVTAQQYAAVLKLCRSIMGRHNITHLAGHRVIDTGRSCPGARWVNTGLLSKLADELNLPLLI